MNSVKKRNRAIDHATTVVWGEGPEGDAKRIQTDDFGDVKTAEGGEQPTPAIRAVELLEELVTLQRATLARLQEIR